jgi:hypothetical protein
MTIRGGFSSYRSAVEAMPGKARRGGGLRCTTRHRLPGRGVGEKGEIDPFDEIWNRALDEDFEASRPGDQALRNVLKFHGLVMGGGLDYAVDVDYQAAGGAADGLRTLGVADLAEVAARAHAIAARVGGDDVEVLDELTEAEIDELQTLDARYDELVPSDSSLEEHARKHYDANPDAYDPL